MAERYRARYSPQGADPPPRISESDTAARARQKAAAKRAKARRKRERRPFWLVWMATPYLFGIFSDSPVWIAADLGTFGLYLGAAALTREGLRAEAAFDARRIARPPILPRKILGAVLTGGATALGALDPGMTDPLGAAVLGGVAMALHLAAFGLDPLRGKGTEGIDPIAQDRVARVITQAETYLAEIRGAILRAGDDRLAARVEAFAAAAQDLFRAVENNPEDLNATRRYLGVYLMGARDATVKFADLWRQNRDGSARRDYEELISDLEANFAARAAHLRQGGREDLDIEIEVLRERLSREGQLPPRPEIAALSDRPDAPLAAPAPAAPPSSRAIDQKGQIR
ncbi:5-bromo-4-chloroindolyl phosphate hydrolysis family protein [Phaeovulum vinaykumarii]|uniref:5-bromo-4-chloroindolyl phosphate hydrolysis protein n=1 Tax=Phaeovulum vinaykumarii TaxID=407234 RepID=A0A1N7M4L9_9RHOB|nr:5-bromo-4-chloroindolyl phosphate hydrolysis family protein [Phaeovulum vinaykumarii]SIS81050.1 5-bromo-4-chloroindolyl phosphate hydrolysis protein [Phaeovulum vinaykumarii]SOC08723.1 5-bromo-4-chloroindolyl phosphate hydrolysis protein [Phaeovulum vinaykumarii]